MCMLREQTTKRTIPYMVSCIHKQFSNVRSPDGHGWNIDEEGAIDFEWTSGFVFPQIDILCVRPSQTSKDVEEGPRILPQKQIT